jgi:hypothetical protein
MSTACAATEDHPCSDPVHVSADIGAHHSTNTHTLNQDGWIYSYCLLTVPVSLYSHSHMAATSFGPCPSLTYTLTYTLTQFDTVL